jgi:hypothetical protein
MDSFSLFRFWNCFNVNSNPCTVQGEYLSADIFLTILSTLYLMQCNFFKRAYKEKLENEQSDDEAVPNQVSLT